MMPHQNLHDRLRGQSPCRTPSANELQKRSARSAVPLGAPNPRDSSRVIRLPQVLAKTLGCEPALLWSRGCPTCPTLPNLTASDKRRLRLASRPVWRTRSTRALPRRRARSSVSAGEHSRASTLNYARRNKRRETLPPVSAGEISGQSIA